MLALVMMQTPAESMLLLACLRLSAETVSVARGTGMTQLACKHCVQQDVTKAETDSWWAMHAGCTVGQIHGSLAARTCSM